MHERILDEALGGVRDAAIAIDGQARIIRFNTNAENLLEWPGDDLVGRPLRSIMPAEQRDRFETAFRRWATSGETKLKDSTFRGPVMTRNGTQVEVEVHVRRFRTPDGHRIVVGVFHPVARHEHDEEVIAVEERLLEERFQLV